MVVRRCLLEDVELRRTTLDVQGFDIRVAGRRGGDVLAKQKYSTGINTDPQV